MVYLQGFQGGISDHDVYVGKNQVAYAEGVDLRDPEYVKLGAKPVNHFTKTGEDEIISILLGFNFFGTLKGFIYDLDGNIKFDNDLYNQPYPIWNIVFTGSDLLYSTGATIGKISVFDVGGDWNTLGVNNAHSHFFLSYQEDGDNFIIGGNGIVKSYITSFGTLTNLVSTKGLVCGIWRRLNNFQCFSSLGGYYYFDGSNTAPNAYEDYSGQYKGTIFQEGVQLVVTGGDPSLSQLFTPGLQRDLFATARTLQDGKKVFHFGRSKGFGTTGDYMFGNNSSDGVSNIIYIISKGGLTSYGSKKLGMPRARNIETTKNSVGDDIDVTAVKVSTNSNGSPRIYFARKSATQFGVDYIDIDSTQYQSLGEFRTQRYTFGGKKVKVHKIKSNVNIEEGTTIKLYVSTDGGSFAEFANLDTIGRRRYNGINEAFEGYDIQFKIELSTSNPDNTPKIYDFSFEPVVIDE